MKNLNDHLFLHRLPSVSHLTWRFLALFFCATAALLVAVFLSFQYPLQAAFIGLLAASIAAMNRS